MTAQAIAPGAGASAAIVTGASGGLGAAIRRRLRAEFEPVVGVDLVGPTVPDPQFIVGDILDQAWPPVAVGMLGNIPLRAVVHCAGVLLDRPLVDTDVQGLRHVLDVNVLGTHATILGLAPAMAEGGVVVLLSSQLAQRPRRDRGAYRASKAAIETMVQDFARELAPRGIRVVGLAPGPVLTPMTRASLKDPEAVGARMAIGRLLEPEEIADIAAFLVSPAAAAITGSIVTADGGYLAFGD
jgi:3-oxoacyl-[acyl-carrier protein] reductase